MIRSNLSWGKSNSKHFFPTSSHWTFRGNQHKGTSFQENDSGPDLRTHVTGLKGKLSTDRQGQPDGSARHGGSLTFRRGLTTPGAARHVDRRLAFPAHSWVRRAPCLGGNGAPRRLGLQSRSLPCVSEEGIRAGPASLCERSSHPPALPRVTRQELENTFLVMTWRGVDFLKTQT